MISPKVSVLVAAYNVENTIKIAIESILNQSYQNVEIIVVNDCSTDKTNSILDRYASQITIITNENNSGLSYSRNVALDRATGNFIMFMDGDDYFLDTDVIEQMLHVATTNVSDLVVADFNYVNQNANTISQRKTNNSIEHMYSGAWNKLYSSYLWESRRFPENILYEDAGIILDIALSAKKITSLNKPIYAYRQNGNTITQSLNNPERHLDILKSITFGLNKTNLMSAPFEMKQAGLRYINHILLGHLIVVKMEYEESESKEKVANKLINYMQNHDLKQAGFSKKYLHNLYQKAIFYLLENKIFNPILNTFLKTAIIIRNKRRNNK